MSYTPLYSPGSKKAMRSIIISVSDVRTSLLGLPSMFGSENGAPILTRILPVGVKTLTTDPNFSVPVMPIGSIAEFDFSSHLFTHSGNLF